MRSKSEARKVNQARRWAAAEQERPTVEALAGTHGKERAPELKAQVLERYAAGECGPAIAEALDLDEWRVYRMLRERGGQALSQANPLNARGIS